MASWKVNNVGNVLKAGLRHMQPRPEPRGVDVYAFGESPLFPYSRMHPYTYEQMAHSGGPRSGPGQFETAQGVTILSPCTVLG